MAIKVDPVVLSPNLGKKWWHIPDALWRRSKNVRERRLRLTLARKIVPLLQRVEAIQLEEVPNAPLMLKGKSLVQIEAEPLTLEMAIYLYELALAEGLIRFKPKAKAPAKSIRGDLDGRVGSCGIPPNDVSRSFVMILASPILQAGGYSDNDFEMFVSTRAQTRARSLQQLRKLIGLPKELVAELRIAMGSLDPLIEKDAPWLAALAKADAKNFIQPLRKALDSEFSNILDWNTDMLTAAASAFDQSVTVKAIGNSMLAVKSPDMFAAIASWRIEKDESGTMTHRITSVKTQVGEEVFNRLLGGSPGLVKDLGSWPAPKIEVYIPYLPMLTGPAMDQLVKLEEVQQFAVLSGLADKLGPRKVTGALKKLEGLKMLQSIVNELVTMNETSKPPPDKVKKLIEGTYFDDYMRAVIELDE